MTKSLPHYSWMLPLQLGFTVATSLRRSLFVNREAQGE